MDVKRVGLWTGSSPAPAENIKKGLKKLKELGYEPVFPRFSEKWASKKESKDRPFLAGPDEAKVQAFVELWKRDDIQSIFCIRGGYGSLRLLALLDQEKLRK